MNRPKGGPSAGLPRADNRPMSIEAMLDMERKEVLALLENRAQTNPSPEATRRSASPAYTGPRSPVRSMLDVVDEGVATGAKPSPPRQGPVRSMLDTDSSPPVAGRLPGDNKATPPASPNPSQISHHRSGSDAGFKSVDYGSPRMPSATRNDPTSGYQFSGIYNSLGGGQHVPKRTQSLKKASGGSLGEALRGGDLSTLPFPGDRGRNSSLSGLSGSRLGTKSKSPNNRISNRSRSPATFSPMLGPNKAYLDDGRVLDINSAYRRLSDANLAYSSGSLSQLPMRKRSDDPASGRLVKDYLGPDGEHLDSSDEDEPYSTDDEDRGRKKEPRVLNPDAKGDNEAKSRSLSNKGDRKTFSLLAAAEEERTTVAAQQPQQYQYKSLLEPEIKVTNSSGATVKPSKHAVHPHTSFDHNPGSATPSMIDSDEEADIDDIRRAQKLSFSMTNIVNNPEAHRSVRIIYRGEYNKIAQAAEEEHHRLRKYLVATDLSDESTHALEWAVGTVLRDGDTLIAIFCVDEETGVITGDGTPLSDDPKEQAAAINSVTNSKVAPPTTPVSDFMTKSGFHRRGDSSGTPAASPAPSGRYDKAEDERQHAVRDITNRVLRLLRKTQLQVRVVVEVIHCKNPKHLITEVIDLVSPTLVVIGSRGRSALKGVILGSFSNYLVTKSSVPVMVARKRLRKQSKYKRTAVRQVNNLSNPAARSLANAKID